MTQNSQWTRRDVLKTGAATVAGIAMNQFATETNAADNPDLKTGWIDAHSHIWTRKVDLYPLAKGQTVDDLKPPSFTAEELIKTGEAVGVSRAVLIQHHTYHGWDNTYLTDSAEKHAGRFRVVGMVDSTRPHPDVVMKKLLKKKVTGFRITPKQRGRDKWLKGSGIEAMWKCAAETRQNMCCLINPEDMPDVAAMCKRYPDTPVVLDHFARVGIDGKIREADLKRLCDFAKHKHVTLKISAYYALGKKKPPYHDLLPMIRRLYETFGPQRLMWASDSPYQIVGEHTYAASIKLIRDTVDFAGKADKEWLLRKTAEKVFFYDA